MNLHFRQILLVQYFEDRDHRPLDWTEQHSDERQDLKTAAHNQGKCVLKLCGYQDDDNETRYDYIREQDTGSKIKKISKTEVDLNLDQKGS